jgi:hypothetical protein
LLSFYLLKFLAIAAGDIDRPKPAGKLQFDRQESTRMSVPANKTLALVEVTRLLFRTKSPSAGQVARVQKLMKSGLLRECQCVGPPNQWTTTAAAIADYLARESLKRQSEKQNAKAGTTAPVPSLFDDRVYEPENAAQLKSLYKGIWSDYFLTVFMQRKAVNHSAKFKRTVLAGQVSLLLGLVFAMIGTIHLTSESIQPERVAVESWIEENTAKYSIRKWHSPVPAEDGEGQILRVEYSYKSAESGKTIITDRRFLVVGDEASLIVASD